MCFAPKVITFATQARGSKQYELTDHLGNIRTVVPDIKEPLLEPTQTTTNYLTDNDNFRLPTLTLNNYYPYGMLQAGRTRNAGGYRFGFQGQEADNKIGGLGQHLNYTFRNYDSWIIRFGAIDPLASKYPYWSPFAFSGNRVIDAVELEGAEYSFQDIWDMFFGSFNFPTTTPRPSTTEEHHDRARLQQATIRIGNDIQVLYDAQKTAFSLIPGSALVYAVTEGSFKKGNTLTASVVFWTTIDVATAGGSSKAELAEKVIGETVERVGLKSVDELADIFGGLEKLGKGFKTGIKGSAVTGANSRTGKAFHVKSDLDFFIVSDELYEEGVKKGAVNYNGTLHVDETEKYFPALDKYIKEVGQKLGNREASIRIYSEKGYEKVVKGRKESHIISE